MLFDAGNMFFGSSPFASASNATTLAALTASGTTSTVINMGTKQDMGIGDGKAIPKIAVMVMTSITSASAGLRLNWSIDGSTDSTNWTTYSETGPLATASFIAGNYILPIDLPRRPSGIALPQYYRMRMAVTGITNETVTAGAVMGGLVLSREDTADTGGQYPSGFVVAA
jgi:hypothetical protein